MHIIEFKLSLFFIIFSQSDITVNCKIEIRGDNHAEKSSYISSRMLDKNTELHPQGWSVGETIKFKKKTAVRLNDIGEVISGTLADDTYLRPQGWQRIINDNYFVFLFPLIPAERGSRGITVTGRAAFTILLCQVTGICVIRMTPPLLLASRARF